MLFESWDRDVLERARLERRPIFLTIGRPFDDTDTLFSDTQVTEALSQYVCIRVDKEEFAELASLYGDFAVAFTGEAKRGSLSLILTPDQRPITTVNAFDPEVLASLLAGDLPEVEVSFEEGEWGEVLPVISLEDILEGVDPLYGGLLQEVKTPMGYLYTALVRAFPDEARAHFFATRSLESISRGAICDPITGGIAREATTESWGNPDSEMRLCDNAHMAKAFLALGFDELAASICQYIVSYLEAPEGGFYASTFGVKKWSREELDVLGEVAPLFAEFHSIPALGSAYLRREESVEEFAEKIDMEVGDFKRMLALSYAKLAYPMQKDTQILPLWNGFAIDALHAVGTALEIPAFCEAAKKAFSVLVPRRFDEYASLIHAALALGKTEEAKRLAQTTKERFKAEGAGPFYLVDADTPILVRRCELIDGAIPSGNSLHAENLLRLYELTGETDYIEQAEDILRSAKNIIETRPLQAAYYLIACQKRDSLRA